MQAWFENIWYRKSIWAWILAPFSLLFRFVTVLRKWALCRYKQQHFSVPVVVVGNITVGGVGKTPVVIALAKAMTEKGLRVGIVSRGYGARTQSFPHEITADCKAIDVGDEPFLMARRSACPVVIAPKRCEAVSYLIAHHDLDVVLSDDGLQHYAMGRALEVVVIDGTRRLGNGFCLPAGPLRESASRLNDADFLLTNGGAKLGNEVSMSLCCEGFFSVQSNESVDMSGFKGPIHAIAGIGNPQRFFDTLSELALEFQPHVFPDHHRFQPAEVDFQDEFVIMTEKDAVKCIDFTNNRLHYLRVSAKLPLEFINSLCADIERMNH